MAAHMALALLVLAAAHVVADEHTHHVGGPAHARVLAANSHVHGNTPAPAVAQYALHEDVVVWVNTVGPYNNRQETYSYYQLPFCRGQEVVEHHHETLGEVLQGMELINAGIGAQFRRTGHDTPAGADARHASC